MRILVTGGAGFLGSHVVDVHIARGDDVVALDLTDGSKVAHLSDNPRFQFVRGSVMDAELMEAQIAASDLVYHLAAVADPKVYVADPLHTLNLDLIGGLRIAEIAARRGRPLVFTSTSEVYGRNPDVPWSEDDDRVLGSTAINRWSYATAKAAVEHYILALHQSRGLEFVIFRPFNFYGPRLDSLGAGRVVTVFLHRLLSGKPVQVHGDGRQTRTFCYVVDAARGIVDGALAPAARNQVFNIGTDEEHSILDLAEIMRRVGGFDVPIETVEYESVFGASYEDIRRRVPDLTRIRQAIGWEATTPLDEGLVRTIEYFRGETNVPPP